MPILKPQTLFVGQHVLYMDEVTSTNDKLKEMVRQEVLHEGFLLMAGNQVMGKGQNGKIWQSNRNENLLSSFLFYPHFLKTDQLHYLVFATSLAVRATVQKFCPKQEVKIKWPNDILIDDKKVAGILIENISHQLRIAAITGIGMNVNQLKFEHVKFPATSIKSENRLVNIEVGQVCTELCKWMEQYYLTLNKANGLKQIHDLYVSQLYKLNETVQIENENEPSVVEGVSALGKLVVRTSGKQVELNHNEKIIYWN